MRPSAAPCSGGLRPPLPASRVHGTDLQSRNIDPDPGATPRAAVRRWGNSLAVRIPARLSESLAMREGTQVDLECKGDFIVVRPKSRARHR
ncbi:MAG: AbrB/MazE/SpoVT family DNA-binding domain-containing protein [Planctomycetia bacterium]